MRPAVSRAALVAALLLTACGGSLMTPPDRALCYAAADLRAQARVDAECPTGPFSECPGFQSILDELRQSQEACR
jgi:hypothetical protein